MIKQGLAILLPLGLGLAGGTAQAVPEIPQDSGWNGHINLGIGAASSESNMLASLGPFDLGDDTISSLDEDAGSEDFILPLAQFELGYTLAGSQTHFYVANQEAEFLNFDMETTLETYIGVRQGIPGIGRVDFALGASSLPTDVWEDPYEVGVARSNTERTTSGIRLAWGDIMETPLEIVLNFKEIDIDAELSGDSLSLSGNDQRLLRRKGNVNRIDLGYRWRINERHSLTPGLGYVDHDLDGDAMAQDGVALQLRHIYDRGRWRLASSLFYEDLESDETNPIYGDEQQTDSLGGAVTFFYGKPFGLENWTGNATLGYFEKDSNIDFYDSSFAVFSIGLFRRFK